MPRTPIEKDAPEQSYTLLRRVVPKRVQPYLRGLRKYLMKQGYRDVAPFNVVYAYTQASIPRQDSLLAKARELVTDGIEGAFVECGVLDGGMSAIMGHGARDDPKREIHLFDAWQGMPDVTEKDGENSKKWVGEAVGSPDRARRVMRKVGMPLDRVVFHKGWFNETLEKAEISKIALLHVDCDFYEATLYVLETFMPKMVSGGWVQIDDYTEFQGCRVAVNEYLERHPELEITVEDRPGGASSIRVP